MQIAAFQTENFTAEYWDYYTEQSPTTGSSDKYFKSKDVTFQLVPNGPGQLSAFSKTQFRYNVQLRNVRDVNGNLVFTDALSGEPGIAYIGVSEPVFDVYGALMGYRHDLSQGV